MWQAFRDRGIGRLILVGVFLDRADEVGWVARAIPDAGFTLVRLVASPRSLEERVRRREIGSGACAQWERTARQGEAMEGDVRPDVHIVATDHASVVSIADEILRVWLP